MKYVFIIGCPRSGTTWLQLLLAQHPKVATNQETHLFNAYLHRLESAWQYEKNRESSRAVGLSCLLTEEMFHELLRDFANKVLEKIANKNNETEIVIEKTPAHVRYSKLILKIFPDADFIHIIRDPRSVVSSLCNAGKSWGQDWASSRVIENARLWNCDVSLGLEVKKMTGRYKEIRYEDLLNNGPEKLEEIFNWLGLKAEYYFCENTIRACSLKKLREDYSDVNTPWALSQEPKNFYRKGSTESWRKDLSKKDIQVIEYITSNYMKDFGYEPAYMANRVISGKPFRLFLDEALDSIEWRLRKGLSFTFKWVRTFI